MIHTASLLPFCSLPNCFCAAFPRILLQLFAIYDVHTLVCGSVINLSFIMCKMPASVLCGLCVYYHICYVVCCKIHLVISIQLLDYAKELHRDSQKGKSNGDTVKEHIEGSNVCYLVS